MTGLAEMQLVNLNLAFNLWSYKYCVNIQILCIEDLGASLNTRIGHSKYPC